MVKGIGGDSGRQAGRALPAMMVLGLLVAGGPVANAATDPCAGLEHCAVQGPVRAQVVGVNVTDGGNVTRSHGVRATIRLTNLGDQPLVLAYKGGSGRLTDDKGLSYTRSVRVNGIGVMARGSADPQFQLAPHESREMSIASSAQYNERATVVGSVFAQELTISRLKMLSATAIRSDGDYLFEFNGLRATAGIGAGAAAPVASAATPAAAVTAAPAVTGDACAGRPACSAQGPLLATVTGVTVTDSGRVTAVHGVKVQLRVQNLSTMPLVLGYRVGTASLTDDQGHGYGRYHSRISEARYVHGIGQVSGGAADAQLQLAPGESRNISFDNGMQYNRRYTTPGTKFNFDVTLVQLALVGNNQVRSKSDYVLSFTGLSAGSAAGGAVPAVPAEVENAAKAVGGLLNLFKKGNK